jgi:hypothetical protein
VERRGFETDGRCAAISAGLLESPNPCLTLVTLFAVTPTRDAVRCAAARRVIHVSGRNFERPESMLDHSDLVFLLAAIISVLPAILTALTGLLKELRRKP